MLLLIFGIALLIGGVLWLASRNQQQPHLRRRILTLIGSTITIMSFFLPWIEISPLNYVFTTGTDGMSEVLAGLLRMLHLERVADVVDFITILGGIPGWLLMLILPTTDPWVRLVMFYVAIVACINGGWLVISLLTPAGFSKKMHLVQTATALLACIFLLICMPQLDAFGDNQNTYIRFMTTIAGVHLGGAVWLAWVGLILIGIGGGIQASSQAGGENDVEP